MFKFLLQELMRTLVFLFAFALCISNASAQLIHSSIAAKPLAAKQLNPAQGNDSTVRQNSTAALSAVAPQSAGQAGMVVTNAWPNPLHTASTLHLEMLTDQEGAATAGIYGVDGAQKATLQLGSLSAGSNELQVTMPDLPSGEYIMRIQQGVDAPEVVRINYIK